MALVNREFSLIFALLGWFYLFSFSRGYQVWHNFGFGTTVTASHCSCPHAVLLFLLLLFAPFSSVLDYDTACVAFMIFGWPKSFLASLLGAG